MINRHASLAASPTLLAAQARLEELRGELQAKRKVAGSPELACQWPKVDARVKSAAELGQLLLEQRRRHEAIAQGPRASDSLRTYIKPESSRRKWPLPPYLKTKVRPENDIQNIRRSSPRKEESVKIYPSLALAMLQAELEAPGRVYWLLKYLDKQGRGWLDVDEVRMYLTKKKSSLRVCGWRRLRQILNAGEDLFWTRDRVGRLWIKGPARVALALGCERLKGKPVSMPVSSLLGGIKQVRAHFYTSFHSGRKRNKPITREKLRELTSVPERSQHEYEQLAGVDCQHNIAVGERYSEKQVQDRAWRQGRATFRFVDARGKQGKPGREYIAWHLPNSYEGPHGQCCKGRQKKINRQLRELVMKGMRANGRKKVERLFWANGAAAGKAYNRNQDVDAYWPHRHSHAPQYILWGVVPGGSRSR